MKPRKRVLIVDDEVAVGNMLAACCDMWGLDPLVATSAAEALEMIDERAPDLIVTDFMMPGMNGHELTRRARADTRTAATPIVLMSAAPAAAARDSPADTLVAKPIDIDHFEDVVRRYLRERRTVSKDHRPSRRRRSKRRP